MKIKALLRRIIRWFSQRCYCGRKLGWFESTCGGKECKEKYDEEWQPFGM
jgi:hypothetical protein